MSDEHLDELRAAEAERDCAIAQRDFMMAVVEGGVTLGDGLDNDPGRLVHRYGNWRINARKALSSISK